MASEGSVAPKERVNIVYKSSTGDAQQEVELPLKMLMLGDYTGRQETTTLEERKPINVDKDNFNEVMANQKITTTMNVPNRLSDDPGAEMKVDLKFSSINDFGPEGVVNQVPEMKKLLDLRNALTALKGPLGNSAAFRKKIQSLISDPQGRQKLMKELGLNTENSGS